MSKLISSLTILTVFWLTCKSTTAKTYDRCELARELVDRYKVPRNQVADWVCLIRWESNYNTSAIGSLNTDGSLDHGLFQISDKFWCYNGPGTEEACGLNCDQLRNDDIKDDWICAKRIFRQHQRLTGNGFNAWVAWRLHCQNDKESYVADCFEPNHKSNIDNQSIDQSDQTDDQSIIDYLLVFDWLL